MAQVLGCCFAMLGPHTSPRFGSHTKLNRPGAVERTCNPSKEAGAGGSEHDRTLWKTPLSFPSIDLKETKREERNYIEYITFKGNKYYTDFSLLFFILSTSENSKNDRIYLWIDCYEKDFLISYSTKKDQYYFIFQLEKRHYFGVKNIMPRSKKGRFFYKPKQEDIYNIYKKNEDLKKNEILKEKKDKLDITI